MPILRSLLLPLSKIFLLVFLYNHLLLVASFIYYFLNWAVYCPTQDSEYPHFLREAFPRPLPDGPLALCPAGAFLNPDFFAILSPPELTSNSACPKTKRTIQDTTLGL